MASAAARSLWLPLPATATWQQQQHQQQPQQLIVAASACRRSSATWQLPLSQQLVGGAAQLGARHVACSAAETEVAAAEETGKSWVPLIPIEALPKGERRLVRQDGQTILLLWYRNEICAIESTSPAEGAFAEGFINAKLTQDGCIVCPSTDSTYELKTGKMKEWYPRNPVLRILTPSLRDMIVYPVKIVDYQICVDLQGSTGFEGGAELVFGGNVSVGQTASDISVDETRMEVDESEEGFGFSPKNELINGRAAMAGFVFLLLIEVTTGKGLLATTGFLNFLYRTVLPGFPLA